jgi:hypothetical protein
MQILEHRIIYKDSDWYSTFPSITKTKDSELLCGFRRAPLEPEGRPHCHLHSLSRAVFVRSNDNGHTWSAEPEFVCAQDELGQQDPQFWTISSGRTIASFFRWRAHPITERPVLNSRMHEDKGCLWTNVGVGVCYSDDSGKSWSSLYRTPYPWPPQTGACCGRCVELDDGSLIIPCYGRQDAKRLTVAYLIKSEDKGETWKFAGIIADGNSHEKPFPCEEPSIVKTEQGKLLCFIRSGHGSLMRTCESNDSGKSWSDVRESTVRGLPQKGCRLSDGRIFLAYGYRSEPRGVRARIFDPETQEPDHAHELVIREDGTHADVGYPGIVELEKNIILCVYYMCLKDNVRHIAGTIIDAS